ncbi:MAG: hypothetical protein P8P44_00590 [Alphaproteobacteria bacterium]|nr:hypothetical protein [Alphaproteobacteria bacterium]
MLNKLTASVLALLTMSGFAYAQEATSQGNSTNFILVDYGFNLSADADIKETKSLGLEDDDTTLLLTGETVDDTSGFIGIGIGHRYDNNIAAVLRYETGETESGTMGTTIAEGARMGDDNTDPLITSVALSSVDIDITTFMLEGVYFIPYSERIELWGLVGVGQSEVETNNVSMTLNGTETILGVCGDSEDNTSTRLGVGGTYYMNQTQGFYAGITMSQYGDASYKMSSDDDAGGCTNEAESLSIDDIETTDFRIGYFRSF